MKLFIRKTYILHHLAIMVFVVLTVGKYILTKDQQQYVERDRKEVCKACSGMSSNKNQSFLRNLREQTKETVGRHQMTGKIDLSIIMNKTRMAEIMDRRVNVLRQNCRLISGYNPTLIKEIPLSLRTGYHHICKVPKCGSTFWAEVFLVMENIINVENLASLDREVIHGTLQEQILSRNFKAKFSDTLLLVTRNPWHRLYSAYMDKIFRLQSSFTKQIKQMVKKTHHYCAEVPTFEQFLEFIVSERSKVKILEPHWRPISNLCRVCSNKYSYVMKLESFVEDSTFVLDKLIPEESKAKAVLVSLLIEKFKNQNLRQIVRQFTTEIRETNNSCVNFLDSMKRLWVSLQSQGLISDDVVFSVHYFKNLSADRENEIVDLFLMKNKEKTLSESEMETQRNRHFNSAYTSVRQRTLRAIRKIYENDFVLFEYDQFIPSKLS